MLVSVPRTLSFYVSGLESPLDPQVSNAASLWGQTTMPCTHLITEHHKGWTWLPLLSHGSLWRAGSQSCTFVAPVPLHRLGQSWCLILVYWINGYLDSRAPSEQQWKLQHPSSWAAGKSSRTTFPKAFPSFKFRSFAMLLGAARPLPRKPRPWLFIQEIIKHANYRHLYHLANNLVLWCEVISMSEENSSALTKEINDIIFRSGNQIPWYKRLPGEERRDSVAPLRLFTSVSFSNLWPAFLCLFPSFTQRLVWSPVFAKRMLGPPVLTYALRVGGVWGFGRVAFGVFFPLFLRNQLQFKIMTLLAGWWSLFRGTYFSLFNLARRNWI